MGDDIWHGGAAAVLISVLAAGVRLRIKRRRRLLHQLMAGGCWHGSCAPRHGEILEEASRAGGAAGAMVKRRPAA